MSSESPTKQTVIPEDIFSPPSSPRTQQRRASYRFCHWAAFVSQRETGVPGTGDDVTVLPLNSIDSPSDEIFLNGSRSKSEEIIDTSNRSEDKNTLEDILPTHSKDQKCLNGDECVIDITDSNSHIFKLVDVDDCTFSDVSSELQTGEEARLETDSKEDGLHRESSEEDCCRICQNSNQNLNDLVSPCHCSGSLGKMHITCLNQWLQLSKRQQCELCGYKYTFTKESLRFADFLRDPELRRTHRQLMWDLLSFALITPISLVSVTLIFLAGQQLHWHLTWDVIGLVTVGMAQLVAYMVWFRIAFQYHKGLWDTWKSKNQIMKLHIEQTLAPKRRPLNLTGGITKRKNRMCGRRRSNQRATENPHPKRFFKRCTLERPTFRGVH